MTTNNNIQNINLSDIQTSNYNPRKTFGDSDLNELAESIKAQGVLQPILLRPLDNGKYEIVYGERRYKASLMTEMVTIPAVVRELSDCQALEFAITENLQRKEVSSMEEAIAYKQLTENNGYDIALLMARFGKSESYIRSRLRLNSLIGEFAELLLKEDINLNTALELCKYSIETQTDICKDHYSTDNYYQSWLGKRQKEVVELIERNYSSNLEDYFFDKSACFDCKFNSNTHTLFGNADTCGKCLNFSCLKRKNVDYIVERAIETHESNPELALARNEYNYSEDAVEILTDKEYDINVVSYCRPCPQPPTEPNVEDYESEEEYNAALAEHEEDMLDFQADSTEIYQKYENGEIQMYALIGTRGVSLGYISVSNNVSNGTEQGENSHCDKLRKQDIRNAEIAKEKIVADTKDLIQGLEFNNSEFSSMENCILYFAMLKHLRRENYKYMGTEIEDKYYLTDTERLNIMSNLTEEMKNIIRRDFILDTLKNAYRDTATSIFLMEFAKHHAPQELKEIEDKHNEVYQKRHERIEEKIRLMENSQEEELNSEEDLPQELDTDFDEE